MSWFLSKNVLSDVQSEIDLVRRNIVSTGQCVRLLKKSYSDLLGVRFCKGSPKLCCISTRWDFSLVALCSLLFPRCSLLFARCSLLFAPWSLLFAHCSLLFARYFLLVARYFLHVARQEIPKDFFLSKSKKKVVHINLYKSLICE